MNLPAGQEEDFGKLQGTVAWVRDGEKFGFTYTTLTNPDRFGLGVGNGREKKMIETNAFELLTGAAPPCSEQCNQPPATRAIWRPWKAGRSTLCCQRQCFIIIHSEKHNY